MKKNIVFLFLISLLGGLACGHSNRLPLGNSQDTLNNRAVNGGGGPDQGGSLGEGTAVSFVTFGDWGSGSDEQTMVAEAIGNYCSENQCDFILTLGDNFYSNGVDSTTDPLWRERYHDVYDFLDLDFYISLGNHDNQGNIQAQIDYSRIDPHWHYPAEEYTFTKPDRTTPPLVEFFIINSDYPNFDATAQAWLNTAIAGSQATWKLLAMHHPIYSNGNHGDGDDDYREALAGVICNRIDLVLSGHDHNFSHMLSEEDGCPIQQLVVGTGGAGLREVNPNDPRAIASGSFHGFGWLQVTADQILFRMITVDGDIFYEAAFQRS